MDLLGGTEVHGGRHAPADARMSAFMAAAVNASNQSRVWASDLNGSGWSDMGFVFFWLPPDGLFHAGERSLCWLVRTSFDGSVFPCPSEGDGHCSQNLMYFM
ncbi:hypothetical protein [Streptomyces sp. YIM 121038]|uniref:hypothetical protein n=1 Tax=Streptomyces sp. YIM 121038 TaxID=2136401 RepID=UPI00111036F4|nr:hypothetical protein [Streptomyces sp. YIM 121038]